jgi:hypothetical protein
MLNGGASWPGPARSTCWPCRSSWLILLDPDSPLGGRQMGGWSVIAYMPFFLSGLCWPTGCSPASNGNAGCRYHG